jgi:uncharacterized membrane protein
MEKFRTVWVRVTDSLWFLPAVLTIAGASLALLLIRYNDALVGELDAAELWWLFGGSADGARSVLESISGSIITVTGVVFSVTIIALQLASTQFTPRVLRQFMADRSNQLVLGVFIGTFTYTLLVQRTVNGGEVGEEFIPELAVTVALALTLTSIGFLIYFIDHAARSVQVSSIIQNITMDTMRALRTVYPSYHDTTGSWDEPLADDLLPMDPDLGRRVRSGGGGYLQALARETLRDLASKHGITARLEVEIGAYILPGQHVLTVWPGAKVGDELTGDLCDTLVLGPSRTQHQDIKHGVIELMDIAAKAMSPAVNDPTTAVNAMHAISRILLDMAWRELGDTRDDDEEGRPQLIIRRPRLGDTVDLAFNQVRHYAVDNPTVAITLMQVLAQLSALSPEAARGPFKRHLAAVIRTTSDRVTDEGDIRRVSGAAEAALLLAAEPPPHRRP